MAALRHKNIVALYDMVYIESVFDAPYQMTERFGEYYIMEMCEKTFDNFCNHCAQTGERLNDNEFYFMISGLADALLLMHEHAVMHLDLHTQNIMIKYEYDAQGNVVEFVPKICDFGGAMMRMERYTQYAQPVVDFDHLEETKKYDLISCEDDIRQLGECYELIWNITQFTDEEISNAMMNFIDEMTNGQWEQIRDLIQEYPWLITSQRFTPHTPYVKPKPFWTNEEYGEALKHRDKHKLILASDEENGSESEIEFVESEGESETEEESAESAETEETLNEESDESDGSNRSDNDRPEGSDERDSDSDRETERINALFES